MDDIDFDPYWPDDYERGAVTPKYQKFIPRFIDMPPVRKKRPVKKRPAQPTRDPITMVLYSPSGNGKTSLAFNFPRCGGICDTQEKGAFFLQRRRLIPAPIWLDGSFNSQVNTNTLGKIKGGRDVWSKLLDRIWKAARDDTIESLVIESVTGIETICFVNHCFEHFDGDFSKNGFYSHWSGPTAAARFSWPDLMEAMSAVHESGKNVIITAHAQVREEENPEGTALQKYVPFCEKVTWARLHRWSSAVFFIGRRLERDTKAQGRKSKAKPDVFDRILYVEGTPYCDAKNWWGLEGKINLGDTPKEGYEDLIKKLYR